jgi:hypothetical protein
MCRLPLAVGGGVSIEKTRSRGPASARPVEG